MFILHGRDFHTTSASRHWAVMLVAEAQASRRDGNSARESKPQAAKGA